MMTCILLAAGQSQRFGSVKALALIEDQPLIRRLQQTVLAADIDQLIIVLGAHSADIEPFLLNHSRVDIVHNKDHNFGQTSSFQCGLSQADPAADGVMLLPVDYPFLKTATITQLQRTFEQDPSVILIPEFQGRCGHPPIFPGDLREEFLRLDVDQGLNAIQHRFANRCLRHPVEDPGVVATFNTPTELAQIQRQLGQSLE